MIASLWEAHDVLCVAVAGEFYRRLFVESEVVGHDQIAYALYSAIWAERHIREDPIVLGYDDTFWTVV